MAKAPNKVKTPHEIEQEMQKLQQEIEARNAKLAALEQQKQQVLIEAKCTFFDVIYAGATKNPELAKIMVELADKTNGDKKKAIMGLADQLRDATPAQQQDQGNADDNLSDDERQERELERLLAEEEAQKAQSDYQQHTAQAS